MTEEAPFPSFLLPSFLSVAPICNLAEIPAQIMDDIHPPPFQVDRREPTALISDPFLYFVDRLSPLSLQAKNDKWSLRYVLARSLSHALRRIDTAAAV